MPTPSLTHYTACLLGGAVGDALGAPVEFMPLAQIRRQFGPRGVETFPAGAPYRARFTDDTQMTLFTAEGILRARHRAGTKGIGGALLPITYQSYLRWLHTQGARPKSVPSGFGVYDVENGWLIQQRGLYVQRAPGNTCMGSLMGGEYGTTQAPLNHSKGCGGIMRVAPVGLAFHHDPVEAFNLGCDTAALTHGHPSGYLSAGCLASILAHVAEGETLMRAIEETIPILETWRDHAECLNAMEKAITLYRTAPPSPETVETLGGAWVGEETLAIALFCALHFQDNFRQGVLTAVNHSGDSDSTGAVTGNILGLLLGREAIPQEWIENLELADVVAQVATDLYTSIHGATGDQVPEWYERYPPY